MGTEEDSQTYGWKDGWVDGLMDRASEQGQEQKASNTAPARTGKQMKQEHAGVWRGHVPRSTRSVRNTTDFKVITPARMRGYVQGRATRRGALTAAGSPSPTRASAAAPVTPPPPATDPETAPRNTRRGGAEGRDRRLRSLP